MEACHTIGKIFADYSSDRGKPTLFKELKLQPNKQQKRTNVLKAAKHVSDGINIDGFF